MTTSINQEARNIIQKGSKSFAFASLFLPRQALEQVHLVYRWCRHCDDQIDQALDIERAKSQYARMLDQTNRALETLDPIEGEHAAVFEGLRQVYRFGGLDPKPLNEILKGFENDLDRERQILTDAELDEYCHQVAGAVGMMLLPTLLNDPSWNQIPMDPRRQKIQELADSLGKAMQLTNIVRDIAEDARSGKCYLPLSALKDLGVDRAQVLSGEKLNVQFILAHRLLDRAERYYQIGFLGLRFLPLKTAWAVALAGLIYRQIGVKIRSLGEEALMRRIYVSRFEKLILVLPAFGKALKSRWKQEQEEVGPSFFKDLVTYVTRIHQFTFRDWVIYIAWIGMMFGLFLSVTSFLVFGSLNGVDFPGYVWNVAIGAFIFAVAISVDTIGHRTVYMAELKKGEALIHHITIFSGITSVIGLCLTYQHPTWFWVPSLVLVALSIIYSLIDEAMHWIRYLTQKSDRVEMWSHYFIMVGHLTMIAAWIYWAFSGYPGVSQTLLAWRNG